jgi:hypothetical protein
MLTSYQIIKKEKSRSGIALDRVAMREIGPIVQGNPIQHASTADKSVVSATNQ